MTEVYIIRHAEAEGNFYRRIHGWYDSRVTDIGFAQLEKLRERFADVHVDAVYSSDLTRTILTARAVAYTSGQEVRTTPLLREVNMGVWEDKPWGEVEIFDREQYICLNHHPQDWHVPGCESFDHLQKRMKQVILDIAAENEGKTVAVTSHGTAIRALLCKLMGLDLSEIARIPHSDNTAVSLLEVNDGKISVVFHNDFSHLPTELSGFRKQKWWKAKDGLDYSSLWFKSSKDAERNIIRFTAMSLDDPVGVIELDSKRGADKNIGQITSYCMLPEYRGMGLSVQLLGQAVSYFRALGRDRIAVQIPANDEHSIGYFKHCGFTKTGTDNNLMTMEMDITLNQL